MRNLNQNNGVSGFILSKGKKLLATTAMTAVSLLPLSNQAKAIDANTTPTGGNAIFGGIDIQQNGTRTDITQANQTGLIHWDSFDHGSNAVTEFHQPNSSAWTFNRVVGNIGTAKRTIIDGDIIANGNIGILDDNGVLIGEFGSIDAAGVLLSTGQISNYDTSVEAGQFVITDLGNGKISNNGTITVAEAGVAAFVAPTIVNNGVINARLSNVVMAAGETVTLDMYGDGLVEVAVDGELADGLISNTGNINAQGGTVQISAAVAKDAVDNVINMSGVTTVSSAVQKGGKIVLSGGNSGKVAVNGALNANGVGAQDAGEISVKGENIVVGVPGRIRANAQNGEAGDIEVIAENDLRINGKISAQGLTETGYIETSAPTTNFGANASVLATREWLLDPTDITIDAALATLLEGQLAVGDMTVQTPAGGTDEGDIGVTTIVDWSTDKTFKLVAADDVFLSAAGGGINATGAGNFVVEAGDDFRMNTGNNSINTNGGNVTITTADEVTIDDGVINANGGNILIDNAEQFEAVANSLQTSGTGTITLNQNKDANGFTSTTDATIQNAVDAISNTGTGLNTVKVGAGTWSESTTIDKAVNIEGVNRNTTFITPGAGQNGFTIDGVIDGVVRILRMDISGGAAGVRVNDTADLKALVVGGTRMTNNDLHGVAVYGDSVDRTRIVNSIFVDNGAGGGSRGEGDILFYLHDGDIELKNIDVQNNTAPGTADYGIQIIGSNPSEPSSLPLRAAGNIDLDNVSVSGNYRAALLGIQEYSSIENLSMNDVALGGRTDAGTDSSGWGSLFVSNLGTSDINLGNITFNAINGQYISMGTDAASTFPAPPTYVTENNIDATGATFEGIAAADLTIEQSFDVEDKIFHKIDFAPQGLVTWQEGNVFVTQASNNIGGGIQRGIDAVVEGGTVNVDDSTYTEDLIIDKSLKLTGHGTTLESAGAENLITVTASDVNIDPFTFDGLGLANYGVNATSLGAIGLTVDGNTFENFNKAGAFVAANGVGTGSIINNTFEGSSTRGIETGDLDGGYTLDIADNMIGTNGDEVQNGIKFGRLRDATINVTGGSMDTSGDALAGGNIGSRVALNLTNLDIEAGDEAADFNGNVDGQVTISGGTLIGAGSGFEANFIGGNGDLVIKDGALVEGTGATQLGLNILRNRIDGSVSVEDSTVKGGGTGIGSAGGLMAVNGSLSISNSSVEGVNGDGIEIGDVNGSVSVSDASNVIGGQNGIAIVGNLDGADIDITGSTIEGNDNGIIISGGEFTNGTTINVDNNTKIAATNGSGVSVKDTTAGGATVSVSDNQDITAGSNGVEIEKINNAVVDDNIVNAATEGILLTNSDGHSIKGNIVSNTSENGIKVVSSDNGFIQENNVSNTGHNGIAVLDSDNATINMKNIIDGTSSAGIALNRTTNSLVDDNEISNTGGSGVWISKAHNSTVSNNIIDTTWLNGSRGTGSGVYVDQTENANVLGNQIENVTRDGSGVSIIESENAVVDDNRIRDVAQDGVHAEDSENLIVTKNRIRRAGNDGINIEGSDFSLIYQNRIRRTGDDGIEVTDGQATFIFDNMIRRAGYLEGGDNADENGADAIYVSNVGPDDSDEGLLGLGAAIFSNDIDKTYDDGIEVVDSGTTLVVNNILTDIGIRNGRSREGGDFFGADAIHLRNVKQGTLGFGDFEGLELDFEDIFSITTPRQANPQIATVDVDFFPEGNPLNFGSYVLFNEIKGTADDGIEVVADVSPEDPDYFDGNFSTLIGYNDIQHVGYGVPTGDGDGDGGSSYGYAEDGYGADAIHARGLVNFGFGLADGDGDGFTGDGSPIGDGIPLATAEMTTEGPLFSDSMAVEVLENYIWNVGDDGVEVRDSGRTNVSGNEIRNVGLATSDTEAPVWESGWDFGANDGDGIHIKNVYGSFFLPMGNSVEIKGNIIDHTGDDGVEVHQAGRTIVEENHITNVGVGEGHPYGGGDEGYGHDAIHIGGVREDFDYFFNPTESVIVRNNIIDVTGDDGIEVHWSGRTSITGNEISHVGYGGDVYYGYGDEDGADAINVMHVTSNDNDLPFSVDIRRNTIDVTADDGIEVAHSSRTRIRNNELTNIGSGDEKDYEGGDIYGADGIHVRNIKQTSERPNRADVRIINNDIFDAADNGIESLNTRQVVVKRNTVDTTGDDGIRIINGDIMRRVTMPQIAMLTTSPHYEDPGISRAVIEQNTVSNAGTPFPEESETLTALSTIRRPGGDGIEVGGFERIFVRDDNVISNSVESGLNVSGGFNGDVEVSGNTFTDNDIGASFESGNIDLTGDGNVFDGGRVGMRFAPAIVGYESTESDISPVLEQIAFMPLVFSGDPIFADMSLVDNTIGAQTFGGQEGNYVELDNEAFFAPGSPTLLNALDSTYLDTPFGAVTPSVNFADGFTTEQVAYFESKFLHFNDNGNTGLFFFPLLPEIDQEDILRYFGPNANALSGLNVTILGLPGIPGGAPVALNNITPAAGGEFDPNDPASLNAIETAAGGEEAGCWGDATSKASSGPVSLSYGGSAEDLLNSEASCGS